MVRVKEQTAKPKKFSRHERQPKPGYRKKREYMEVEGKKSFSDTT